MVGVAHYFRILRVCLFRWSTDQVDPAERFDHWREVRAKGLFGVTAELEREQREHFRGEFALQPIGKAGLIEIHASSYRVERTAGDITNAPSDSLCIYQQLSQGGWFDTHREDFTVRRGTFATSYSDLKYRTVPTGTDGFRLRILKIPLAEMASSRSGVHALSPNHSMMASPSVRCCNPASRIWLTQPAVWTRLRPPVSWMRSRILH
jgi:hypothetical protein